MLIVWYFDWNGTTVRLEEYDAVHKKRFEKKEDIEFLGRYVPMTNRYQRAYILKAKNIQTWADALKEGFEWDSEIRGKLALEETCGQFELFGGPRNK